MNARMALSSAGSAFRAAVAVRSEIRCRDGRARTLRRNGQPDVSCRKPCSLALPPDRDLGTDRNQRRCLFVRGKPYSIGAQRVPLPLRPGPGTVLRFRWFRPLAVVDRLSALRRHHVLARRVAAPDRQYVDLVAVRESGRRPTRLGTLSRLLFRLRDIGVGNLRGTKPELHGSGTGRLGSDCRNTRLLHAMLLHAIFPILSHYRADPYPL